jgi:hypothetical protein
LIDCRRVRRPRVHRPPPPPPTTTTTRRNTRHKFIWPTYSNQFFWCCFATARQGDQMSDRKNRPRSRLTHSLSKLMQNF